MAPSNSVAWAQVSAFLRKASEGFRLHSSAASRAPRQLPFKASTSRSSRAHPQAQATAEGLGLKSARDILSDTDEFEGVPVEDIEDLMVPEEDGFVTIYDEALAKLSTHRAVFGAFQTRMQRALDFIDVTQENFTSAKSRISDTDYAQEVARLTENNILSQAATGLLAQTNFNSTMVLNLLSNIGY